MNANFLLPLFMCCLQIAANAQTNGRIRENLIASAAASCAKTQREAQANRNVEPITLQKYCNCVGNYFADILTNNMVAELEDGKRKLPGNMMELAGKYCRQNYATH